MLLGECSVIYAFRSAKDNGKCKQREDEEELAAVVCLFTLSWGANVTDPSQRADIWRGGHVWAVIIH